MEPVRIVEGVVTVLNRNDVDTDQIIPKQFLKRVERTGFGEFLFYDWAKEPGWDLPANPILATGRNFGSGSSREHAPWALGEFGFRVIIAPSFADIFANNCFKNGMLPIAIPVREIMRRAQEVAGYELTVNLETQMITDENGLAVKFEVGSFQRYCLLEGLDDIGLTLKHEQAIKAYEASR